MNEELLNYVRRNFRHFGYLNTDEGKKLNLLIQIDKYTAFIDKKLAEGYKLSNKDFKTIKDFFEVTDSDIKLYSGSFTEEINSLIKKKVTQGYEINKDKIFLNYCPACKKLARTPVARQCSCGHNWRDSETRV